jgi:hypothetical protein
MSENLTRHEYERTLSWLREKRVAGWSTTC